jgi:HJR/Mrr/RecB family endonuclease
MQLLHGCLASIATTFAIIAVLVLLGNTWMFIVGALIFIALAIQASDHMKRKKIISCLVAEAKKIIENDKRFTILDFINIYIRQNNRKLVDINEADINLMAKAFIKIVPGRTVKDTIIDIKAVITREEERVARIRQEKEKELEQKMKEERKKEREAEKIRKKESEQRQLEEQRRKEEEAKNRLINQNVEALITNIIYPKLKENDALESFQGLDIGIFKEDIELLIEHIQHKYSVKFSKEEAENKVKNMLASTLLKIFKEEIGMQNSGSADAVLTNYIQHLGTNNFNNFNLVCLSYILKKDKRTAADMLSDKIRELEHKEKMKSFEDRLNKKGKTLTIEQIDAMDGYSFEDTLRDLFKSMNFEVQHTSYSGDNGADVIVKLPNKKVAIQAKNYTGNVGNAAVQEIVAAKVHYQCDIAMVITNSYYTKQAVELAATNGVILVDRDKLIELLKAGRMYFINLCN